MSTRVAIYEDVERGEREALEVWEEALAWARESGKSAALTGAGISVESGVPDFRSPQGVWARFPVEEYGTIEAFFVNPPKAWRLYRAIWGDIGGKEPNGAHRALAELERAGRLAGLVTQNIDNLHHAAGSRAVIEIHGDARRLQCVRCGRLEQADPEALLASTEVPHCADCGSPLKPNVVFFGEAVRGFTEIDALLADCELMVVAGTSSSVWPANTLPLTVARAGGRVIEFNLSAERAPEAPALSERTLPDILVLGEAGTTLPAFASALLG